MSDIDAAKRDGLLALAREHEVPLPCTQHTTCIRMVIRRHGHEIPEELTA